ncbi:MAG: helix-turn-helix transcriptional regulator [Verrucomicrobiota bacterium]
MNAGRPAKNSRPPFGERLYKARTNKGLTQDQMASQLGITQTAYTLWERRTIALREDQIKMLVQILGVTPNYLYGQEE